MKRNRLILAALIAGVALTSTSVSFSFAWYASATRLRVENIVLEVDTERELLISNAIDGEYKPRVSLAEGDLEKTSLFAPVTTAFGSTWEGEDMPKFYDMSYSQVKFSGEPYVYEAPKRGYFCQELFLKADDNLYVTIKTDDYPGDDPTPNTRITPNVAMNEAYAEELVEKRGQFSKEEYVQRLNGIVDCARVAVLIDDHFIIFNPNKTDEGEVYYGGALDNDRDRYYDYYQDQTTHELYEVFYGELKEGYERSDLVYTDPESEDSVLVGEWSAFNAIHKAGVHRLDLEASKPFIQTEHSYSPEDFSWDKGFLPTFQFELDAYVPKRIVVAFYLEGWDLDSHNAPMGAYFDLELIFRIVRER